MICRVYLPTPVAFTHLISGTVWNCEIDGWKALLIFSTKTDKNIDCTERRKEFHMEITKADFLPISNSLQKGSVYTGVEDDELISCPQWKDRWRDI